MNNKAKQLYKDWIVTRKSDQIAEAKIILETASRKPILFKKIFEAMGYDGQELKSLLKEEKPDFENDNDARKAFSKELLSITDSVTGQKYIEPSMSYMPITDRSNTAVSNIDVTVNGVAADIVAAITGGNMEIAAQLCVAGWGRLSLSDRNAILNLAMIHGGYNSYTEVDKDSGVTKYVAQGFKEIKNKTDMTKDDFLKKAFPMTDIANMKV